MPHVSSIFPKLVSAVTIVMASSDATRNAMKCEFFRNKIVLPSKIWSLGGYEFGLEIESVLGKFENTIYNDI